MQKKYVYKPYSDHFPDMFAREKTRLKSILNDKYIEIEHIGSTSVPGLGGKGIIDIGILVKKYDIDHVFHALESLGYIFRETGSSPERWFFRIDLPDMLEGVRRYHVHLTYPESTEWKKLITFRDYLRSHPDAVQEYAALKQKSAEEVNEDGALYRQKKAPFFDTILSQVL